MRAGGTGTAEALISRVLRTGVVASLTLIGGGMLVTFVHHPSYSSLASALGPLTHPGLAPRTLIEIAIGLAHFRGQSIVAAGLLVLLLTPIARVALSIFVFARERDWCFTAVVALVLCLLLFSLFLGQVGL